MTLGARDLGRLAAAIAVVASAACVRAPYSSGSMVHSPVSLGAMPRAADAFPLCPSALGDTHTDVQDVDDGVIVDVTANDAASADAIRARANGLLSAVKDAEHSDFAAAKRGGLAYCPVVVEDTHISTAVIDRGVRFVVTTNPSEVTWLRHETRARFAELRVPTVPSSPALAHCPSALPSALTSVRDGEGTVVVTVVSRDADVADAIRGRAWHIAEASKNVGAIDDDASGSPQCPIFAEGTSVDATEIPGGSEITIRPDDAGDLARLRRIVRARVASSSR